MNKAHKKIQFKKVISLGVDLKYSNNQILKNKYEYNHLFQE